LPRRILRLLTSPGAFNNLKAESRRPRQDSSSEPSVESLRRECNSENEYTTHLDLSIGRISCRFKVRRKSARMDFSLDATAFNIVPDRWREFVKAHDVYVKANFARNDWKDMALQLFPDGLCLDVLREDVEEWFDLLRGMFDRQEGMTGVSPLRRKRGW
jgi:hypothetical protein